MKISKLILILFVISFTTHVFGKENNKNVLSNGKKSKIVKSVQRVGGCAAPTSKTYLEINNVRALMLNGGDMWWNFLDGQYEVPKGSNIHALFAGSIWIGGMDAGFQLKIAGMTYRQTGNDYFAGPLNDESLSGSTTDISAAECAAWDKHFSITSSMISEFKSAYLNGSVGNGSYIIPDEILNWPAHGNQTLFQSKFLAPYKNLDGQDDGLYDPFSGDFPDINGDQSIWWVINDKGNSHSETQGQPIGLEIHVQAFGFVMQNELNEATFYEYKLFNKSSNTLNDTYLGQWVDPDLGNYQDDYVGCDIGRGLGYCYNGDNNDQSGALLNGYGTTPPAIGLDFFKGPKADPNDGIDNDRDGVIDEMDETIIMSNFLYYNNTSDPVNGNPSNATHFYNYLQNLWGNGLPCTYDGAAGLAAASPSTPATSFMFPGDSDPSGQWTGISGTTNPWTESTAGNPPGDRRFLQSAGPFSLSPGQVVDLTIGVVWARAITGDQLASLEKLKEVDDLAQSLFDTDFQLAADFTYSSDCGSLTANFADFSKGSPISWKWDFGDGDSAMTQTATHTFSALGSYTVRLEILDVDSHKVWITKTVVLSDVVPNAMFSAASETCLNSSLVLTDSSSGFISDYQWKANGVFFSNTKNATYTFKDTGLVNITLIVKNGGCLDSISKTITVQSLPTITLDQSNEIILCKGEVLLVNATGGTNLRWYNSNNQLDTTGTTLQINADSSTYYYVYGDGVNGCTGSNVFQITVHDTLPSGKIYTQQDKSTVQFTDSSSNANYTVYWDLGDGTTSTSHSIIHTYDSLGLFQVMHIATNGCGSDTTLKLVNIDTLISGVTRPFTQNYVVDLNIFPNPSNRNTNLQLVVPKEGIASVYIYSLNGQKVGTIVEHKYFMTGNNTLNFHSIEADLNSGIYIIQVRYGAGVYNYKYMRL